MSTQSVISKFISYQMFLTISKISLLPSGIRCYLKGKGMFPGMSGVNGSPV